jgi:uncharacterized protein YbjT (DUF2867 family)
LHGRFGFGNMPQFMVEDEIANGKLRRAHRAWSPCLLYALAIAERNGPVRAVRSWFGAGPKEHRARMVAAVGSVICTFELRCVRMAILVTGSTGTIGSQVLSQLKGQAMEVRALTRSPEKAQLPAGITPIKGDLADIDSVRQALSGVSTLFLLAPNVADELTQAMLALNAAREAGVKGIVYFSVFKSKTYADVPHFAGKNTVERMIDDLDLPATVLRPAYFMQNDLQQKEPLLTHGVYGAPIGPKGISMVDIRDIGKAAAIELLRRDRSDKPLGRETYELVGPESLNGEQIAAIWGEVLGRPVRYGGGDLGILEQRLKTVLPSWHAMDLRLMFHRYQTDGAVATAADVARLTALLRGAPRSYRDFAKDAAAQWARGA